MELKLDIKFDQLVDAIKQLPADQLAQLTAEISSLTAIKTNKQDFQDFLLQAPVFTDEQVALVDEARNDINKWGNK